LNGLLARKAETAVKVNREKSDALAELSQLAAGTHQRQRSLLGAYQQSADWRRAVASLFHAIERGCDRGARLTPPAGSILPGL
jgi:hypothetical protein